MSPLEEQLQTYSKTGKMLGILTRTQVIKRVRLDNAGPEQDATFAVPTIDLMLTDSSGRLRLVRRGNTEENQGVYSKTAGGHVKANEDYEDALHREGNEEVGITIILSADLNSYPTDVRRYDLTKMAVVRQIDFDEWRGSFKSKESNELYIARHRVRVYAGMYDGEFSFNDGEADNEKRLTVEQLEEIETVRAAGDIPELKISPNLWEFVKRYKEELKPIYLGSDNKR